MSTLAAPFRPLVRSDTYRALLFLAASVPIGAAALALLIAGWVGTAVLLVTPLVVAAVIAFRAATGLLATADAAVAATLVLTVGAVEKHIASIFQMLRLPPSDTDHRRVLAVLEYLRG